MVALIINERLKSSTEFHDALHGFRAKRGTETTTIEANLLQQIYGMCQKTLCEIFLDLHKAYDALDREQTLNTMAYYGVRERMIRLLWQYWKGQKMAARESGYYSDSFGASCGIAQGDPLSLMIFNIAIDSIVRHWAEKVGQEGARSEGFIQEVLTKATLFYEDNDLITSLNSEWIQWAFNVLTSLFERVGLLTNFGKKKSTILHSGYISGRQSYSAYKRRMTGEVAM